MKSRRTHGRISRWAAASTLLALLLLGGVFLADTPKHHGYAVFQVSESLKVVFLQRGQTRSNDAKSRSHRQDHAHPVRIADRSNGGVRPADPGIARY
jgi:hypothetical protein